jgi:diguanylate cyclase (GGDEF)-like protein/PAS domain S-box-containing protein
MFVLLLAAVVAMAVWRARDDRERHRSLQRRSAVVSALDDARAEWFLGGAWITTSALVEDPAPLLELHRQATLAARENLDRARAGLIALGDSDELAALDEFNQQMDQLAQEVDTLWVSSPATDRNTRIETAQQLMPRLLPAAQTLVTGLEQLANGQQAKLAYERAAADRAADTTLELFIALGLVALVGGTTTMVMLILSVVRPLASLRKSVRAMALGDLQARVKVSGPEEVASLAHDFNEMVSARRLAEEALRESEARYKALFVGAPEGMLVADLQTKQLRYANPAICRMLGYTEEEFLRMGVADIHPKESLDYVLADFEARARGEKPLSPAIPCQRKDGSLLYADVSAIMVVLDGRKCNVGFFTDVTERRQMEEALHEQARRDPLTGVLNHGAIVEELRNLLSGRHDRDSHAVAMVDVDGLKAVNDTYGHQAGDAVLLAVASALSRDGAVVGRYGGDEFVVVLPGADRAAAELYREGVLSLLRIAALHDPESGAMVPVAVSLGLAIYPTQAHEMEELVKLADDEMYAAKRQRPVRADHLEPSPHLSRGLAAEIAARLAPLLTSRAELKNKLQLLAQILCSGAGYDAVNITLYSPTLRSAALATTTLTHTPGELAKAWTRDLARIADHPVRQILARTRRPIILDDPQQDPRITDGERQVLRAAGLHSALVTPIVWEDEFIGTLSVAGKREAAFGPSHAQFLMGIAAEVASVVRTATLLDELKSTSGRLKEAHTETVMLLAASAEAHDRTTGRHLENVRAITEALARELDSTEEEAREMGLAAVLHDIGKVRVPDSILASVGRLTDEQWQLMKQHTVWGQEFLAGRPGFELAATIARSHHERWDGGGYPDGLSGGAIPEAAAIVAVADAFDAITSDRPYRAARSVAAAIREIVACSGGQFSPKVVKALVRLHKRKMLPRPDRCAVPEKTAA